MDQLDVQNVGMMINFAPDAISSLKASGKAMSQHMRRPTGPRGVSNVLWGFSEEEVRWGRSGCLWRLERVIVSGVVGIPDVFLLIASQYLAIIADEVGYVM
jgi:hypothetical protein